MLNPSNDRLDYGQILAPPAEYYIDFASKYGIEYVILDEGWAVNGEADLFSVVPEIDLPMLVN